jgi:glycerol-3-phosphate dehydrogenase
MTPSREQIWQTLTQEWDILVIGGGITGAGILRQAAQAGLRAVLVEAGDFASGTSSRSSKLIHGGLRYLRNRQFNVTRESVKERQRLLREAPQLVTPLKCIIPDRPSNKVPAWKFGAAVILYDLLAPKWQHGYYPKKVLHDLAPQLCMDNLHGGYYYYDALIDDARLVLRSLQEAAGMGACALNYARVESLLAGKDGQVRGVALRDQAPGAYGRTLEVTAKVVINATGPGADFLRAQVGGKPCIRKQRGSHIIFPWHRLPIQQSFTLVHPRDRRVMFAIPWDGVSLIGTTDLDHPAEMEARTPEPVITQAEVDYLLEALADAFPALGLGTSDIRSTFSGLRPIVNLDPSGAPSKQSRQHVILQENGLVTITGGKLTTYRLMAHQTLMSVRGRFSTPPDFDPTRPTFDPLPRLEDPPSLPPATLARLLGRYGAETPALLAEVQPGDLERIDDIPSLWAEVRWAARHEQVMHLDDLLLRRVRLGLLAEQGGMEEIARLRRIAQPELGWEDARWEQELSHYQALWKSCYYLP